jgi:hypothetical protein
MRLCCFLDYVCLSVCLSGWLACLVVLLINPHTKASHFLGNPPSSCVTHPLSLVSSIPLHPPPHVRVDRESYNSSTYHTLSSRTVNCTYMWQRETILCKSEGLRTEVSEGIRSQECVSVCVCACVRNKDGNRWT